MRYGLLTLALFLCSGVLRADPPEGDPVWHPKRELPQLFRQARDLAPDRAGDIDKLESEWVPRWMRQRTELRIAEFELNRVLTDPNTTSRDLARALDRVNEERVKLHKIEKEALLALHRTLGGETFARLMQEHPFMLRLRGMKHRFFPDVEEIEMELQKFMEGMKEAEKPE